MIKSLHVNLPKDVKTLIYKSPKDNTSIHLRCHETGILLGDITLNPTNSFFEMLCNENLEITMAKNDEIYGLSTSKENHVCALVQSST